MKYLTTSHAKAEYLFDNILEPITVGQINAEIEVMAKRAEASSWCIISACNPLSVELSKEENILRKELLKRDLAKYQIFDGERRSKNDHSQMLRSFLVLGISKRKAKDLARKFGQQSLICGETGKTPELIETLFTQGNREIIRQRKTAFLCSRMIPASIVLKCYDWAIAQRDAGNCVISGFHSTIEKDVLHYLLKGNQPIIVALARGIKKRLEPELADPLREGRLLVITPFEKKITRASKQTAIVRNRLMADMADLVVIGYKDEEGVIARLTAEVDKKIALV